MRKFPPMTSSTPPTVMVGSSSPASKSTERMDVVVVLPWVPAMPTECGYCFIIWPSSTERGISGILRACAAQNSSLSLWTAAVYTTKSMSFVMFSERCPMSTRIPSASSSFVKSLSCQSEPETVKPRLAKSLARPLMLMPPMPMK